MNATIKQTLMATLLLATPVSLLADDAADQQRAMDEARSQLQEAKKQLREARLRIAELHSEMPGKDKKGFLGIVFDADEQGVVIVKVVPESGADKAGVKGNDRLTAVDDTDLKGGEGSVEEKMHRVVQALGRIKPGDVRKLSLLRDGEPLELAVTAQPRNLHQMEHLVDVDLDCEPLLGNMPWMDELSGNVHKQVRKIIKRLPEQGAGLAAEIHQLPEMGSHWMAMLAGHEGLRELELVDLNPQLGDYFGAESGVLVIAVGADNPLQLQAGDVILAVGERTASSARQVRRVLFSYEPGETINLSIKRKNKSKKLSASLPQSDQKTP